MMYGKATKLVCESSAFDRLTQESVEYIPIPDMTHRIVVVDEDMEWEIRVIFAQVFLCLFELVRGDQCYPTRGDIEFFHDKGIDVCSVLGE